MKKRYKLSRRKKLFALYYFDFDRLYPPSKPGNAYRCALRAGYSESYAKKIMSYMRWEELESLNDFKK